MKFDRHTLVLLVRPPNAPELTDEEAAELQDRHLAFEPTCATAAISSAAGRSSTRTTTLARHLDHELRPRDRAPAQQRGPGSAGGRLAVEVMTWMVPAGNVRFEDVPAPRSTAEAED